MLNTELARKQNKKPTCKDFVWRLNYEERRQGFRGFEAAPDNARLFLYCEKLTAKAVIKYLRLMSEDMFH